MINMLGRLVKYKPVCNNNSTSCEITNLVVKSALELNNEIQEKAKQLHEELLKLEKSRIGK